MKNYFCSDDVSFLHMRCSWGLSLNPQLWWIKLQIISYQWLRWSTWGFNWRGKLLSYFLLSNYFLNVFTHGILPESHLKWLTEVAGLGSHGLMVVLEDNILMLGDGYKVGDWIGGQFLKEIPFILTTPFFFDTRPCLFYGPLGKSSFFFSSSLIVVSGGWHCLNQ